MWIIEYVPDNPEVNTDIIGYFHTEEAALDALSYIYDRHEYEKYRIVPFPRLLCEYYMYEIPEDYIFSDVESFLYMYHIHYGPPLSKEQYEGIEKAMKDFFDFNEKVMQEERDIIAANT